MPVGEDQHHLVFDGFACLGPVGDAAVGPLDEVANGVVQRGDSPCPVGVLGQLGDVADALGVGDDFERILSVEQHRGHPGLTGLAGLFGHEPVEPSDDVAGQGLHGAGTVEQEPDFGSPITRVGDGFYRGDNRRHVDPVGGLIDDLLEPREVGQSVVVGHVFPLSFLGWGAARHGYAHGLDTGETLER